MWCFFPTKNEVLWEKGLTPPTMSPTKASSVVTLTTLAVGQELMSGKRLKSPNGQYELHMQGDVNLVLYDSNGNMDWETARSGSENVRLAVHGDCKLVIYADSTPFYVWSAGPGSCGTKTPGELRVQDDGNVVFFSTQNEVLWARW